MSSACPRMVRFRCLWLSRTDDLAALLSWRRAGRIAAVDFRGFRRWFCDAVGGFNPVRDLWRPSLPPRGIEHGRFRDGTGDLCDGTVADLSQVGVLAPALLVVVRLCQGLSAGGEWGGST